MSKCQERASLHLKDACTERNDIRVRRVVVRKSKSPFLFSEEQKSGISRGYCRDEGTRYGYWAVGHTRGIVRGQVNTNGGIQINGLWKKFGHKELEMLFEEKYLLG